MKLIVAEKASVARNIASALGARKTSAYWTGNDCIITNCVGHLCTLAMPEDYNPALEKWALETLPILPAEYKFVINPATRKQFALVQKLMLDKRVDSIINACDGDREGEHIFRLVYQMVGCRKPVERLWISSMEEPAILEGMQRLRPMSDYDALAAAARCRAIADWIAGINFSRLYTVQYNQRLTVGRVQTPTVNMVVQRELEIQSFQSVDYYIVTADLGEFKAALRCDSLEKAQEVLSRCAGSEAVVGKITSTEKKEKPPKLYNLTALQQDCNQFFGATAAQTLKALQELYENKLATHPRTDSCFLTEKDKTMAAEVLNSILSSSVTAAVLKVDLIPDLTAVINDGKVEGHPALLPTVGAAAHLEEQNTLEKQILLLLMFRLLEATAPIRHYISTKAEILIAGYTFTASGTVEQCRGWKQVEDAKRQLLTICEKKSVENPLPLFNEKDSLKVTQLASDQKQTTPPQRYTEATLLEAMKNCGKALENEAQREAIKDCGLGTPATRAQTLENIIWTKNNSKGLLTRGVLVDGKWKDTKHLYPTKTAMVFMSLLPDELKTPSMTGEWERQLCEIARGTHSPDQFSTAMEAYVRNLVNTSKQLHQPDDGRLFERETGRNAICLCPVCKKGSIISSRFRGDGKSKIIFHCTDRSCSMKLGSPLAGRNITDEEVAQLCKDGISGWLDDFVTRENKPFSAKLKLVMENGKADVRFARHEDLALCACPVCKTGLIVPFHWKKDAETVYEGWQCSDKNCCLQRFYTPKYRRHFSAEEVQTLFTSGQLFVPRGMKDSENRPIAATIYLERDKQNNLTGKYMILRKKERVT